MPKWYGLQGLIIIITAAATAAARQQARTRVCLIDMLIC
jgi:hypothetical protein